VKEMQMKPRLHFSVQPAKKIPENFFQRVRLTSLSTDLCTDQRSPDQPLARRRWITFHRDVDSFGRSPRCAYIPLRRRTRKCTAKLENGSRNGDRLL